MRWILVVLLIAVIIFTIRLTFKLSFSFSFFENSGHIKLKLFKFITIFKAKVEFTYYYVSLHVSDKKTIKIKFDLDDINLQFINDLQSVLLSKTYLITFLSELDFGLEDAFNTAIIYGNLILLNQILFLKLLSKNEDALISMNVFSKFTKNILILKLRTKFILSLFDLVWAFMYAVLNRRLLYNEKK